ncbi:MAG: hypothetical protein JXP73_22190, partial [Deltaproteobacteria bacterium]|nr:hypothetical protein [Deltaproteobacteria bacterium]
VMTDPNRTYLPPPQQNPLLETGMAVQSIPGAHANAALASGAVRRIPRPSHGWWGRYDRGSFARNVLPGVARVVGETSKAALKADPITLTASVAAAVGAAPATRTAVLEVLGEVSGVLTEIAVQTRLHDWPDPEGGDAAAVKDWFERYHGVKGKKKGADVFEDAGKDLLLWLKLLKQYQTKEGGKLPVRLAQLGDLFDFWIGLKCPFELLGGARDFPNKFQAAEFVKYWMEQSLENPAIEYLWHFDRQLPVVTRNDLKTVFLYGNHDTYTGCLLPAEERTKERFDEDPGLVAQHGHQEDRFNKEGNAAVGYLLTQAVFADDYVRTIEDPVSSLGPTFFGGSWTRLDLAEMAIKACLFHGEQPKKKRAMMFVMGHTHEPVLQVIHVVAQAEDKEKATSTETSTATSTTPAPVVSPDVPASAGQSRATSTSTGTSTSIDTSMPKSPQTPTSTSTATSTAEPHATSTKTK